MNISTLRRLALRKGLIVIWWCGYVATMEPLSGAIDDKKEWRRTGEWKGGEPVVVPALTIDECADILLSLEDIEPDHLELVKEDIAANRNWRWAP